MAKTTPWNKIKAEYLKGSSPKELAEKYSLKPKAISNKATIEKWAGQRKQIKANISKNIEEEINDGAKEAINFLRQVINSLDEETKDRISAAKGLLDVSGLKTQKHEVENKGINIVVLDDKHKQMLEDL